MSLKVLLIVLIAAGLHAIWNLAARKVLGNLVVLWIGLCIASICCLPFALAAGLPAGGIRPSLPYLAATGILHACYFALLAKSYEEGEISVVYPIARGSGVAGAAVLAYVLVGEQISFSGGIGISLICVGTTLVGLSEFGRSRTLETCLLALLVGSMISGYSMVDKLAVGRLSPVAYIFGMFVLSALFLAPYVTIRHGKGFPGAWRDLKRYSALIGLGSMGTYLMILFAFQLEKLSYVVAAREFAVVIGSVMGFALLNERISYRKALGIASIAAGLFLIKMA